MAEKEKAKSIDPVSLQMIEKAACDGVNLSFDRALAIKPCPIGEAGSCCKVCSMGPCRVPLAKGKKAETLEEKRDRKGGVRWGEPVARRLFDHL